VSRDERLYVKNLPLLESALLQAITKFGGPEEKRSRLIWEDNIKTDFEGVGYEDVDWFYWA
jgi:hypothetical protein